MLTSKQRAFLKGLAQKEPVILQVGKLGINDNLIDQLNNALRARELVKIGVLDSALMTAAEAAEQLAARTSAQVVQVIGNRSVLYRKNSHDPKINLGDDGRKPKKVSLRAVKAEKAKKAAALEEKNKEKNKKKRYYSDASGKRSTFKGEKRYEKRIRGKK